ncbi:MAG TPA: DNA topoisomerase IB [Candidatus Eisenbacteria bacterium]|nr:DNA topoisomerase IB [Candidatus Eisenbacteria bacterium]
MIGSSSTAARDAQAGRARSQPTWRESLERTGIRRLGSPRAGFRWRAARGRRLTSDDYARLAELRIPPAWTDVWVSADPDARVQAMGRDRAGRDQYLYHPRQAERRERHKFDRVRRFAAALPRLRRAVARDLARPGLPREKVHAAIVRILSTCFLRPGSAAYADENGSYGIATLRRRHVAVRGHTVVFDFRGKSGKDQHAEVTDRRVAGIVRALLRLPGAEVFKWVSDDGHVADVRRRTINAYIKEVMGGSFSAKDFRTWAGTLVCACALAHQGADPAESRAARRRKLAEAIRETAALLGNTPAVCRSAYIQPRVLERFEHGQVLAGGPHAIVGLLAHRGASHHPAERALLALLEGRSGRHARALRQRARSHHSPRASRRSGR